MSHPWRWSGPGWMRPTPEPEIRPYQSQNFLFQLAALSNASFSLFFTPPPISSCYLKFVSCLAMGDSASNQHFPCLIASLRASPWTCQTQTHTSCLTCHKKNCSFQCVWVEAQGHWMLQGEGGMEEWLTAVTHYVVCLKAPPAPTLRYTKREKKKTFCLRDITVQNMLTLKSPCGSYACCDYSRERVDYVVKQATHGRRDGFMCLR